MDVREILEEVKKGTMDTAAAEELLRANPASRSYEEMGYAKLDTDRRERSGFAEVVYCQGKSDKFIADIFQKLYELDGEVFGTRASSHQYELVKERIPDISYDPVSHILKKEKEGKKRIGCVAVCTGGTADISVAEEAAQTAEYFGTHVERIYDVGVSGIHRILSKETLVRSANFCHRRPREESRHRRSDIGRLWRQLPRPFGASDDDQFLRERHRHSQY